MIGKKTSAPSQTIRDKESSVRRSVFIEEEYKGASGRQQATIKPSLKRYYLTPERLTLARNHRSLALFLQRALQHGLQRRLLLGVLGRRQRARNLFALQSEHLLFERIQQRRILRGWRGAGQTRHGVSRRSSGRGRRARVRSPTRTSQRSGRSAQQKRRRSRQQQRQAAKDPPSVLRKRIGRIDRLAKAATRARCRRACLRAAA